MELKVCVGSACHLKGSYEVIEKLKFLIERDCLKEIINLSASFCLGKCGKSVTVKMDEDFLEDVNPDTVETVYNQVIKPKAV